MNSNEADKLIVFSSYRHLYTECNIIGVFQLSRVYVPRVDFQVSLKTLYAFFTLREALARKLFEIVSSMIQLLPITNNIVVLHLSTIVKFHFG